MSLVILADAYVVEDTSGKLWIPLSEIPEEFRTPAPDIVKIGEYFFDVMGYSMGRKSLWIKLVDVEGAAEDIDAELQEYLAQ